MNEYENDTSILHTLLSLPKHNLETKLREVEEQLKNRTLLNETFLSTLLTCKRQLKDAQYRLRYHPNDIQKQIVLIDALIQKEELSRFHDENELTDKLHAINEEISLSTIKLTLLDNENSK